MISFLLGLSIGIILGIFSLIIPIIKGHIIIPTMEDIKKREDKIVISK